MSNGSQFYVDRALELVVDPLGPPVVQNQLLEELKKCDDLVQLDWRYAQMVAGASKMPMNMIWVARNQDEPVSDTDLAALKDIAWSEIVKKRYLASIPGTSTVSDTATSMLEIVREMNLQRRRFQIMGLHEQVEASEIHLVLHLCQAGLIRTDKYRTTANRFRRHDKLFEAFGLAVGAFVCASAPFTLGAATTRYERDLQYEYKKNTTALFVYVLQQNMGGMNAVGLEEDYVARIARLIVVWPDEEGGGGKRRIGFKRPGKKGGDDDDDDGGGGGKDLSSMVLDSVAVAQDCADKAHMNVLKLRGEFETKTAVWEEKIAGEKAEFVREMVGRIAEAEEKLRVDVMQAHRDFEQELRFKHEINHSTLASALTDVRSEIKTLANRVANLSSGGGGPNVSMAADAGKVDELEAKIREIKAAVDGLSEGVYQNVVPRIRQDVDGDVNTKLAGLDNRLVRLEAETTRIETVLKAQIAALNKQNQEMKDAIAQYDQRLNARFTPIETGLATKANVADLNAGFDRIRQEAINTANAELTKQVAAVRETMQGEIQRVDRLLADKEAAINDMNGVIGALRKKTDALDRAVIKEDRLKSVLKELVDNLQAQLAGVVAAAITKSETKATEQIAELKLALDSIEETQAYLSNTVNAMNEDFAGQLTGGLFDVDKTSTTIAAGGDPGVPITLPGTGKRSRGDTNDTREALQKQANDTREAMQKQKLTDLVKSVADLYMKQSDWDAKIMREVRRCVAEQVSIIKPDPGATPAAAAPAADPMHQDTAPPIDPMQFDARLKQLEQLFLSTTSNTQHSPFTAPPALPSLGNFNTAGGRP